MQDFETFRTKALAAVQAISTKLENPDADLAPFVLGQQSDDTVVLLKVADYFENDEAKNDLYKRQLPQWIAEYQFIRLVIVNAVWTHDLKALEDDGLVKPEEALDAREAIVAAFFDRGGLVEYFDALVYRRAHKPPTLGGWQRVNGDYRGRLIRPIVKALG